MIKIVGLCGSPKHGATEYVLEQALNAVKEYDPTIETELITLAGKNISPCCDCGYCKREKAWCILKDDMQELFDKLMQADGILVASPVYAMMATPQLHAFCSRMRPVTHCFPGVMRNKFAAAIAVGGTRNGGQETTVSDIIHLFATRTMNIVSNEVGGYTGGKVWSQDRRAEGAAEDVIGMETVTKLAKKLAEVCTIYDLGKQSMAQKQQG